MKTVIYSQEQSGISLLEILISIAIFSAFIILLSSVLSYSIQHKTLLKKFSYQSKQLEKAANLIRFDLVNSGAMGCLNLQNTIIEKSKTYPQQLDDFSAAINFFDITQPSRKWLFGTRSNQSDLDFSSITSDAITLRYLKRLDLQVNNINSYLSQYKYKRLIWTNCQIAISFTPNQYNLLNDNYYQKSQTHQLFILNANRYFAKKNSKNKNTLYKQSLSQMNKAYSRPILENINDFSIYVINQDNQLIETSRISSVMDINAILISISISIQSNDRQMNTHRLVKLSNLRQFHLLKTP